ncbi:hypothetical protein O3P69_002893 [Scylla paramamosain]|uniref:Uncharacterized protein n=1 Tax=Scylla paramamosain TaxID=85552 RepID=A0AAW0URP3_SCYPA
MLRGKGNNRLFFSSAAQDHHHRVCRVCCSLTPLWARDEHRRHHENTDARADVVEESAVMAAGGGGVECGGGGGVGGGGGGGGRRRRHHGEQRSGVPTVVEDRMEAAHPSPDPAPPRLAALRGLVPKVLIGHQPVTALEKVADSWLLSCPSNSTFGEECELVATLLYTTLTFPSGSTLLLPQDLVFTFIERWVEDGGRMEFSELINLLKLEWKCGAAQVLFLLCANLMPDDWGQPVLQADVSAWTWEWLPNVAPPPWLLDVLGSSEDLIEFITLLRVSALLLQGAPISQKEWKDSYLGTLTRFLCAVSQYQQGDYSRSLDTLHNISYIACERRMQAWVLHLGGLGLANLGKPHTALMKLQDAVERSPASLPALYNIAQVFQSLGEQRAELEVLDLLVKSGRGKPEGPQVSLHFSLLALHHTPPGNLISRAQYYLSCRLFQEKKYLEAAENLKSLLDEKAPDNRYHIPTPRSLLRPKDTLPTLPTYSVLLVLAAMAHMSIASHQHALRILSHQFTTKGENASNSFIYLFIYLFFENACRCYYIVRVCACDRILFLS